MHHKQKIILGLFTLLTGILTIHSCKKEPAAGIDLELYNMSKTTDGFIWYKNTDALLPKSAGSGHSQPYLRTRYNTVAATKLAAGGAIQAGATFPEGSLIVKELYSNPTTLARYAILYKQSSNTNADAKGWVWGYINADGTVAEPASSKGSGCISCHSQADNIDYMLMNKYF